MLIGLSVLLTVLCLPCFNSQGLESIPSTPMVKNPQEVLSLSCRGSGFTFGSSGMHWVREPPGKPLEHIGAIWYDASKTVYDTIVEGRIEITRDNSNSMVYLKLSNLKPEDSAVYYCTRNTQYFI
uniref:Ig-like domain-containing protein n=1 Tax=Xiphophorus maculatus TaxID=8083 RepID=A0A3B5PVL3_XIPMA